jgi:hypothetical protein
LPTKTRHPRVDEVTASRWQAPYLLINKRRIAVTWDEPPFGGYEMLGDGPSSRSEDA